MSRLAADVSRERAFTGIVRRVRPIPVAVAVAVAVLMLAPSLAAASENVSPSTALAAPLGVPLSGTWEGTVRGQPNCLRGNGQYCHWWRVAPVMRTGDTLTIAVDHTQGKRGTARLEFCLLAPGTDDFGANAALGGCRWVASAYLAQDRITLGYTGPTGQPLLVVSAGCCSSASSATSGGIYAMTLESVATVVQIGAVLPKRIAHTVVVTANVRFGDNTPAVDGLAGWLEWKRVSGGAYKKIGRTTSADGRLRFRAKRPTSARGRVRLRACVAQPGGKPRCTPAKIAVVARR